VYVKFDETRLEIATALTLGWTERTEPNRRHEPAMNLMHTSPIFTPKVTYIHTHTDTIMKKLEDWLTWALSPSISAILVTLIFSLTLPILIHTYLYKRAVAKELPTFLLLGPSGAGKTSLLTLVRPQHHLSLPPKPY